MDIQLREKLSLSLICFITGTQASLAQGIILGVRNSIRIHLKPIYQ
jgi:hypothetical protein